MSNHNVPRGTGELLRSQRLLDYDDAGAYLGGVSRSTLKGLTTTGRLRPVRIGRRTLFAIEDLDAYVRSISSGSMTEAT